MLILLDIDGVMVTGNSWKRPEFLNDGFPAFSNRASSALQKMISETSADILLTTSHKSNYSIDEWKNIFNLRGIKIRNIYSLPENKTYLSRKHTGEWPVTSIIRCSSLTGNIKISRHTFPV